MTQVSLKRALKIKKSLDAHLGSASLNLTADISIFVKNDIENPAQAIEREAAVVEAKVQDFVRASAILAGLRGSLGEVNASSGVDALLARQGHLDRQIKVFKHLAAAEVHKSPEIIKGDLELTAKTAVSGDPQHSSVHRYTSKSVTVSVVTAASKKAAADKLVELREEREKVEDERVFINGGSQIEITEADLVFLRELGVV